MKYVSINNLSFAYEEGKTILDNIDLDAEKGGVHLHTRTVRMRQEHSAQADCRAGKTYDGDSEHRR